MKTLTKIPRPLKNSWETFNGDYSRRINFQHRLLYQVLDVIKTVKVIRMWTHYE
jgi:toxin YoeB